MPAATNTEKHLTEAICELQSFGLLEIKGPDASTFLQGQLTANADIMQQGDSVWAAHCNPKGRINANFFVCRHKPDGFVLLLPANNIQNALQNLNKYAVFSKVTIEDVTGNYRLLGIINFSADSDLHPLIKINDELAVSYVTNDSQIAALNPEEMFIDKLIEAGIGFVVAETSGEFIPQMLNMDLLGGISFNKGCYTGQEVIARLKYKGEVKRRCYRWSLQSDNDKPVPTIAPGANVLDGEDRPVGTIVCVTAGNSHSHSRAHSPGHGLAVLKTTTVEDDTAVFIANPDNIDEKIPCQINAELPPYAINN